jgi:O-antigen/teichoic acid export membrane protein
VEHHGAIFGEQGEPPSAAARRISRVAASRLRSPVVWQAIAFAGASLAANGFAVVATSILTRHLNTSAFGSFSFALSVLFFAALFFEFGLLFPAGRLAALAGGGESRNIVGAALLVYLPIGVLFAGTIFALSFWIDGWFNVHSGHALRVAAPVAIAFPFPLVLQQIAQGVDRLHVASAATASAQFVFVALLALRLVGGDGMTAASGLLLRSLGLLLAMIGAALWLRPTFHAVARWTRRLAREARQWGFQLFIGRVLSIGTYNMDVLMLGVWTTSRSVGFYVLAGAVAAASGLPVTGAAAALFARMAHAPAIAQRWLVVAAVVGTGCALAAWLLAEPAIRVVFSARYLPAATLVLPLALAQLVRGVTGIFNTFLSAHGRGRELRNAGFVLTLSNIAFNFALIPPYGAKGAAWASLLALVANLVAHVVFYRRAYARPA